MSNCIFCKIVNKELPAEIAYEDDKVLAFKDLSPQAPTHLLIIPKKHISTMNDIQDEDVALIGHIKLTAAKIAKELGFADAGYRVVMNCNEDGGQTVYHIHLHLLAGRSLAWPPG